MAVVAAVHFPALSAQTISFDDHEYLINNHLVKNPGWASAKQFFTEILKPSTVGGYYQPLSMISLMLDYRLAGTVEDLHVYHRTSLILHVCNAALVMLLIYLLFEQPWIAFFAGLLFGVHPMTVEPIPWLGERKTLLAAFFAFSCLVTYVCYTRRRNKKLFLVSILFFILALLSKPTSIPIPVLLLLLDYWPLNRLFPKAQPSSANNLTPPPNTPSTLKVLLEKLPFFILAAISAVITVISQSSAAAVVSSKTSFSHILLTICHNIIFYLHKILWPTNLTSHYPFPDPLSLSHPAVALGLVGTILLLLVLLISWRWTRSAIVGWAFFMAACLPTMQVLRFSDVIASDKFAYLPSLGFVLFLSWLLLQIWNRLAKSTHHLSGSQIAFIAVLLIVAAFESVATRRYLFQWQNTERYFRYLVQQTPQAAVPHFALGCHLQQQNRIDEAVKEFATAVKLKPDYPSALNNLAKGLLAQGKTDQAIDYFRQALRYRPGPDAHLELGYALQQAGKLPQATEQFRKVVQLNPDSAIGHNNLASALWLQGQRQESMQHFATALKLNPDYLEVHNNLAAIYTAQNNPQKAQYHRQQAQRIQKNQQK